MVKFQKQLEGQLVPQWRNAYVNYKQLKKIIGQIREQMVLEQQSGNATHGAQHRPTFSICTTRSRGGNSLVVNHKGQPHDLLGSEVEESYQTELLGPLPWLEREEIFFSRLDSQLNMVNNFYKTKEREFLLRSKQLEVQLETLVEIRGQLAACKIGDQDDSDKETDICRCNCNEGYENLSNMTAGPVSDPVHWFPFYLYTGSLFTCFQISNVPCSNPMPIFPFFCRFDRCRLLAIWVYRGWEWKRNGNSSVSDSSLSVSDRGIQRKLRPKLTFSIFCQIFVLGLLGPVIDQNFSYLGLKLTSPTYACALSNVLPCMTFVIALLLRMEKVNIKKVRGGAKLVGTIVCVGGAMLMTLYRGPIVRMFWSPHHQSSNHNHTSAPAGIAGGSKDWIVGSVLMVGATLAWSILFILQSAVLKKYPAQLSLAALICLLGTLQATALSIALVREPSKWALGWDINLLTAVYSGVVASAVAYYVQGLCMRVKGPVFATAFSPLVMIIVAVMGSVILSENIYLGSVLGGVMIAIGLYAVLWGKLRDSKASMDENHSEALPSSEEILPQNENNENKADDIEAASNDSMDKGREPFESDGMKQLSVK